VALHSFLAAVVLYAWARHLELPSGRPKRLLLALVLTVPLVTAAVPGRSTPAFRDRLAWLDSARLLQLPLIPWADPGGSLGSLRLAHLVLALALAATLATLVQELLPALGRLRFTGTPIPSDLGRRARSLPGWEHLLIDVVAESGAVVATTGLPGKPRLLISPRALQLLGPRELDAVLRHENAHWLRGRWIWVHLLFAARAVQFYNPVALWVFRHFSLEHEIACDRDAVAGTDAKPLVRALLLIYEATNPRDLAARNALRPRVDTLRGRLPVDDRALPIRSIAAAAVLLLLVLPWVV